MQTTSDAIYAETGRFPLYIRHQVKALKYWLRILKLPETHPVKQTYYTLRNLDSIGQQNWCTKIRKLLDLLGKLNVWAEQSIVDCEIFITECLITLQSKFKYDCMHRIKQSVYNEGKLRSYQIYKDHFELEPYLLDVKDTRYRTALTRFRLNSHNLGIEIGRHSKPKIPLNNRICAKCDTGLVEDEIHFLLVCTKFGARRRVLFDTLIHFIPQLQTLPREDQFKEILRCRDIPCLLQLGKFIHEGFNIT